MMKRLYDRGLTTCLGGNISLRVDGGRFLITPSGADKAALRPRDIALVDADGHCLGPARKLSIETAMHRLVLQNRPDVRAVVHAHPVYACAFSAMEGCPIDTRLTAEAWWQLVKPVLVPYHTMGSEALARAVAEAALQGDVLVLANHGVVTMGDSLLSAFEKIDVLERACRMTVLAWQAKRNGCPVRDLTDAQCGQLRP